MVFPTYTEKVSSLVVENIRDFRSGDCIEWRCTGDPWEEGKKARKHNPGDKITRWTKDANAVVIF